MKSQVLSNFHLTWLTITAFFIFMSFFVFVIYWTFRKGTRGLYGQVESIPFNEQEPKK